MEHGSYVILVQFVIAVDHKIYIVGNRRILISSGLISLQEL